MQTSVLAPRPKSEPLHARVAFGTLAGSERRTLAEVLGPVPMLGARRLVLIALQLATELDLAHRAGNPVALLRAENVRLDRPGTPFEQAMLPRLGAASIAGSTDMTTMPRALSSLGRVLALLLAEKSFYLEGSMWTPSVQNARVLRRRADVEVLSVLGRVLGCIARRCTGGPRAYASPTELVADLSRLATATTRLVARRKARAPFVCVHYPKPRARPGCDRLPRVMIRDRDC